ncbi:MAG: NADH-quinone oxidoreductase subunit NuoK [Deltaproteobacteria bacterium]|nr:NADH-quinone oxidoreductase subunit NuoK [Deltaproteobacteria bacterium]
MVPVSSYMLLAAGMFSMGLYGVLTRKNVLGILLSVELMANAVNVNLVAIGRSLGDGRGEAFALFAIALTVAEVVVGLAIVIFLHRSRRSIDVDQAASMHG